jgi:rod shape-determining protein MreC
LKQASPADTVGAKVISAPLSRTFRTTRILIDGQGRVAPGMAVIAAAGLVGRIDKVFGTSADVMLLTDPNSSVEVVVQRTGARGVVTGLGRNDAYACKVQWLERPDQPNQQDKSNATKVSDVLVTSGLGTSFPAGVPVGVVSAVSDRFGMFQDVEMTPMVQFSSLRAVLVLLAPPPPADPRAGTSRKLIPIFGSVPF